MVTHSNEVACAKFPRVDRLEEFNLVVHNGEKENEHRP